MDSQDNLVEQDVDDKLRASRLLLHELDEQLERGRAICERRVRVAVLKDEPLDPS